MILKDVIGELTNGNAIFRADQDEVIYYLEEDGSMTAYDNAEDQAYEGTFDRSDFESDQWNVAYRVEDDQEESEISEELRATIKEIFGEDAEIICIGVDGKGEKEPDDECPEYCPGCDGSCSEAPECNGCDGVGECEDELPCGDCMNEIQHQLALLSGRITELENNKVTIDAIISALQKQNTYKQPEYPFAPFFDPYRKYVMGDFPLYDATCTKS